LALKANFKEGFGKGYYQVTLKVLGI